RSVDGWTAHMGHNHLFLQAEAGIRDFHVTGVQTCALPIWIGMRQPSPRDSAGVSAPAATTNASAPIPPAGVTAARAEFPVRTKQIGRASCRERVENADGAAAINRDKQRRTDTIANGIQKPK